MNSLKFNQRILVCLSIFALASTGCQRIIAPEVVVANEGTTLAIRDVLEAGAGKGGAAASTLANPTGFADLTGTFTIIGTPPSRSAQSVTSDQAICAPGGKAPLDEVVVVGPNGGIKDVLIYLDTEIPTDNPVWIHPDYDATKNAIVKFDQKNCIFLSHVFAIRTTQKMQIMNSDTVGHNTNLAPRKGANSFNQIIAAGGAVEHTPGGQSPDPFSVSCNIHPWMKANMITRDSPYFAVTGADGKFTIPNVPAGVELEFRVWQEGANFLQSVTLNGAPDTDWAKGRFKITLQPGTPTNLDVQVNADKFNK